MVSPRPMSNLIARINGGFPAPCRLALSHTDMQARVLASCAALALLHGKHNGKEGTAALFF